MDRIMGIVPWEWMRTKDMNYMNRVVRENTAFTGMMDLIKASEHGYRPTIHVTNEEMWYLAEVYDATMKQMGSELRAYRPRNDDWKPNLLNRVRIEAKSTVAVQKMHVRKNLPYHIADRANAFVANYEITVHDEQGNMRDRDYPQRLTLKDIKSFVAHQEEVAVEDVMNIEWKHTYSVGGRVEGESYKGQHSLKHDQWEEDWWGTEEYFDIDITKDDLIVRRGR